MISSQLVKKENLIATTKDSNLVSVVLPAAEIKTRIKKVSDQIAIDYSQKKLRLVVVREGACWFANILYQRLIERCLDVIIDYVTIKTYNGVTSSGKIKFYQGPSGNLRDGRQILVVEDLIDSGLTWLFLQVLLLSDIMDDKKFQREITKEFYPPHQLLERLSILRDTAAPLSIDIVALLEKRGTRLPALKKLPVKYSGFQVRGDLFLFGCGLDLKLPNFSCLHPRLRKLIRDDFRSMEILLGIAPDNYLENKDSCAIPLAIQNILELNEGRKNVRRV